MADGPLFLFVTANENEKEAFKCVFISRLKKSIRGHSYFIGTFGNYEVAYIHLDKIGTANPGSTLLVGELIGRLSPVAVIMVGIAFGVDQRTQKIGDVLVSEKILNYDFENVGESNTKFYEDPKEPGFQLFNAFKTNSEDWIYELPNGKKSTVIAGSILTGSKLINNYNFRQELLNKFKEYEPIGGEMEAFGIYTSCRFHDVSEWIIVKGICDWGFNKNLSKSKKEKDQKAAARAAVSYCETVFLQNDIFNDLVAPSQNNGNSPKKKTAFGEIVNIYQDLEKKSQHDWSSDFSRLCSNSESWFKNYLTINSISIDRQILAPMVEGKKENVAIEDYLERLCIGKCGFLLFGEGGIGKSYILFDFFNRQKNSSRFVPLYVPMKELNNAEESPVLMFIFDQYFIGINCDRNANCIKETLERMVEHSSKNLILLLDGLNEYAICADTEKYELVKSEISWLQGIKKIAAITVGRSKKGFESDYAIEVKNLDKRVVARYLKEHDNTKEINTEALRDKKILELLQNPLLLSLFTKTYSPKYTNLNNIDISSIRKHSDILTLCIEYHKHKLSSENKDSVLNYALDVLLPLVSMDADTGDTSDSRKYPMGFELQELMELAYKEVRLTLSSPDYKTLWTSNNDYSSVKRISEEKPPEVKVFNELIDKPLLENALFLRKNTEQTGTSMSHFHRNETISWQHEMLMEWFVAKGIVLALHYQYARAIGLIESIAKDIENSVVAFDKLVPIALFLTEILEDSKYSCSKEFILLLRSLSKTYSELKDIANTYKFAIPALTKLDTDCLKDYPALETAALMNHLAYSILQASRKDMKGFAFNYSECIEYTERYFKKAINMIYGLPPDIRSSNKTQIAEAQIYGNLGALNLAKFTNTNEFVYIDEAISYHKKGLDMRLKVYGNPPVEISDFDICSNSYNCLATDYYYLGSVDKENYNTALSYHRKTIELREKGNSNDMRKIASYINCIGALNKLLHGGVHDRQSLLKEALGIYERVLNYPESLKGSNEYLKRLMAACGETFSFIFANPEIAGDKSIGAVRRFAELIDGYCAEKSIESDLSSKI
jgi:nucleoside phosphorylase